MSSTELEVDIPKAVPKLKGDGNFSIWGESLEIALKAKEPIYWNILCGYTSAPEEPQLYTEDTQAIIQQYNLTAGDPQVQEQLTEHVA